MKKLNISSSPHIHSGESTSNIMLDVIISLIPASVIGIFTFGYKAVILIAVCILSSMLFEYLGNKIFKRQNSLGDLSAVVTGLLLALNLPSGLPVFMAVIGSFVAIFVVKQMFGGIGSNFVNPAITGRIVLLISFPSAMTTFYKVLDNVTAATPIADKNFGNSLSELLIIPHSGSIGEASAIALIVGGLYLVIRRVIKPIIPLAFIGSVAFFTFLFVTLGGESVLNNMSGYSDPVSAVFKGGVLLGAIFMATDYVTSPTTNWGKLIFGIGCGLITVIIRSGTATEGVSFSILFMNLLVPHIEKITMRKPFGLEGKKV